MKHTCKEILLEVQLFRQFSKGCTAGTPSALTSKACELVEVWNINNREILHCVGLNHVSVTELLESVHGEKNQCQSSRSALGRLC